MWVRPGEQMIPVADMPKSPFKRKRYVEYKFLLPGIDVYTRGCVCLCALAENWRRKKGKVKSI